MEVVEEAVGADGADRVGCRMDMMQDAGGDSDETESDNDEAAWPAATIEGASPGVCRHFGGTSRGRHMCYGKAGQVCLAWMHDAAKSGGVCCRVRAC